MVRFDAPAASGAESTMIDESADAASYRYRTQQREALRPIREHRAFIAVFILSAMATALLLTYAYSERYGSEVTIFFKPADVTYLNTHVSEALGSQRPVPSLRNVTQTIDGLAKSDVLLRRIVKELSLDVDPPRDVSGVWYIHYYKVLKYALQDYANDAWSILSFGRIVEDDPVNRSIVKLRKAIKIGNEDSYVYSLKVTDSKPQRAAAIADKVSGALTDLLRGDDKTTFDRQRVAMIELRDEKGRRIEVIETEMRDLLAAAQVASIKDELEKITDRASKIQQQRGDTMADLRQSDAKVAASAEKLRVAVGVATGQDGEAATRRISRISPDDYGKISGKKLDSEVESSGLRARLAALDQIYNALIPRIGALSELNGRHDVLSVKLTAAKRDFSALSDAVQELEIRTAGSQSELHIQAAAQEPAIPLSPIKIYHVLAAGLLAAIGAIGLAYMLDYFEIRLFLPPAGGERRRRRGRLQVPAPEPSIPSVAGD
jgi:uncharacterized protein involved in exopolysaccharide biosynthesis